ncbi:MAG: 4-amino-4-deoxy-L-arabinose transferase, partial [Bacteroidota bacterium]|nr:4-amino-4-deoxy-L-arabinose transferase [Bacteroidota bacterium]
FKSSDPELAIYSTIIGFVFLGLTGLGFIYKVSKKTEIFDFIFLCYLLVIFLFSFVSDYRYIVPIHIFLMLYLFTGLKYLAAKLRLRQTTIAQLIFVALILFMYSDHLHYIWTTRNDILEGPYEPISQETFAYLRTHIPDDQIIVFNKARTLALYTGKKTTIHNFNATSSENYRRLHAMGARYYLLNPKVDDFNYVALIRYKQKDFKPIYQNWQFTLFEDTTAIR